MRKSNDYLENCIGEVKDDYDPYLERDEEKTKDLRWVVNEDIRAVCCLLFLYTSLENEIALH